MRLLMTGILKSKRTSNKQVFMETVLEIKKIKIGKYIASERNYFLGFSWLVCIFI